MLSFSKSCDYFEYTATLDDIEVMQSAAFHVGAEYTRFPNHRNAFRGPDEYRVFMHYWQQGVHPSAVFSGDPFEGTGVGCFFMKMLTELRYNNKYPILGPTWNADLTLRPENKYTIRASYGFWEAVFVGLTHTHIEYFSECRYPKSSSMAEWGIINVRGRSAYDEVRRPLVAALQASGYRSNLVDFTC